jgi:uncharacterized protein (DUF58 family)
MTGNWWLFTLFMFVLGAGTRQVELLLVGLLLALIGGTSLLWARYCLYGVTYQRRFNTTRLFHGDELDLSLDIVNAKPMPLAWLIAVDDFPSDLTLLTGEWFASGRSHRRLLVNSLSLRWYERVTRHYRLLGVRRGVWEFGPAQLSSGDIFGFAITRQPQTTTQTIIVYPRYVAITKLGLPSLHPFGEFKTPRRLIDDPLQLRGARSYAPGDSFRHIHWKASARRRDLQTKVFEPSASRPLAIFLDSRTAEFANEGIDRDLMELGVTVAASIAHWGWQAGHPTGVFANASLRSNGQRLRLPPKSHPTQFQEILEALAWMAEDGQWRMNTIVSLEAKSLPLGTTLVVVTALVNGRLLQTLRDLQRQGFGVTLITVGDWRSRQGDSDDLVIADVRHYEIAGELWHEVERLELAQ